LFGVTDPEFDAIDEDGAKPGAPAHSELASMVVLANAVFAGLAGVFTATRSIVVTGLAAGLVALLGVSLLVRRSRRRGSG
jgi:hypothetical protein